MFPVLTNPRGSRNASLVTCLTPSTLYELSAWNKESVFDVASPLTCTVPFPLTSSEIFESGPTLVLTRSAHDFGALFWGGGVVLGGASISALS